MYNIIAYTTLVPPHLGRIPVPKHYYALFSLHNDRIPPCSRNIGAGLRWECEQGTSLSQSRDQDVQSNFIEVLHFAPEMKCPTSDIPGLFQSLITLTSFPRYIAGARYGHTPHIS
ncbi:hypothetical protein PCH_Pc14g01780 [Penicillium rubens Wisconsin 54-1255]|uniref:Uncharacterized protein n=1 Tax=Penicillium rubens (strain ATCC 28089 / DSM 1075 / NRRL 1951 / Wisconsin 54-1255) TaxID=500485 RepID=B6H606_PENRW|nr:hypothetical protein PCH_Pc14g01780 [Penicillium rubens Wisconsin 54-1255]